MSLRLLLWFDVENERYTTRGVGLYAQTKLWFDVENERYTTILELERNLPGCGLM